MDLTNLLAWALGLIQLPLLALWTLVAGYVVFLTLSAVVALLRPRRRIAMRGQGPTTRFTILVPAHNESLVIGECVRSLRSFDYPEGQARVIVIADNCTDDTAVQAKLSGALVYERSDAEKRGKGYALDWALNRLLHEDHGWTEAVIVFDADTLGDPQFLHAMDARLHQGALALQGQYDVLNPFHNWRTALLYCALLLHNRLRPLARQMWGGTTLLKGNGMCFARSVVERFGWSAYSLTEDIEYTTTLLNTGIKVQAVPEAMLYAQMPQTGQQATSQRMRWEGGRFALARLYAGRLIREFLAERSLVKFDWAMELLQPPLAILVGVPLALLALDLPLAWGIGGPLEIVAGAWAVILGGTFLYVIGGLLLSRADPRAYLYLLCTPLFLLWKVRIYAAMLLGRGPKGWVRTERTAISESRVK